MIVPASDLQQDDLRRPVQFREIGRPTVRSYFQYRPASARANAPTLVLVHGISRRAAQLTFRFVEKADEHGVVLVAPLFQKVIYGQYQQVIDKSGTRSDLALLDILDASRREMANDVGKVHLFGYSGGAQFAHRFALLHPERVASLNLAAAGWYTMPDIDSAYPLGVGTHPLGGDYDLATYLAIERHVFVGSLDVMRDPALRKTPKVDTQQGPNRVERARTWFDAMQAASQEMGCKPPRSSFDLLPGVGHSFGGSARRTVDLPSRVFNRLAKSITIAS